MLVVMQAHATEDQVRAVCQKIEKLGYRAHLIFGSMRLHDDQHRVTSSA